MSSSGKWGHHLPLRIKWNKWQRVFVNRNLSDKFWLHDFFLNIHPFQVYHWVLVNLQLCGQHPIHSDHPHHSTAPACLFAGDGLLALGQGSHWSAFCLCGSASSRNFTQTESDNTWHFAFGFLASAQCGSGPSSLCVHQKGCPYGWISLYGQDRPHLLGRLDGHVWPSGVTWLDFGSLCRDMFLFILRQIPTTGTARSRGWAQVKILRNYKPFSKVAAQCYIPTSNLWGLWFLHSLITTWRTRLFSWQPSSWVGSGHRGLNLHFPCD